jgi:hypothetical protein
VKTKREQGLAAEAAQMLGELAKLLDAHSKGKSLDPFRAAAYRDVIGRILSPPAQKFTAAQSREIRIALDYAIRRELFPDANRKATLAATGQAHGATDKSVDQLKSEWKKYVEVWLARLDSNIEYTGLARQEMLERELRSLLSP